MKKLIIKVAELCTYESDKATFEEAIKDIEENFNSDNIIYSNDDFDGSCLDSVVTSYELI